jgi:hypothetical protein
MYCTMQHTSQQKSQISWNNLEWTMKSHSTQSFAESSHKCVFLIKSPTNSLPFSFISDSKKLEWINIIKTILNVHWREIRKWSGIGMILVKKYIFIHIAKKSYYITIIIHYIPLHSTRYLWKHMHTCIKKKNFCALHFSAAVDQHSENEMKLN